MNMKSAIPALAVCFALSGVSAAYAGDDKGRKNKRDRGQSAQQMNPGAASAAGLGVAAADRNGAVAGGLSAAEARTGRDRNGRLTTPNAAQTNSSGAVYTSRRNSAAAVTSSGSAAGTGQQSTASTVDATARPRSTARTRTSSAIRSRPRARARN
jgi:hypothetical protein